ncbi:MAG: hypothetical protein JWN71_3097 [Xanthobacteraceae bacterium]|jgi:hypothetical protein|nr:hypothetical protein [Xanthobacteraceae bacterium]
MKQALTVLAVAATLAVPLASGAHAENGRIATGVLGGLAAGAILGTMAAQPQPRYYEPAPVYVAPPPRRRVYVEEPVCHVERGEPVWDDRRGVWFRPRVQVCD